MAHPDRLDEAKRLTDEVGGELFLDTEGLGAWGNHERALRWASEQPAEHALILQDDAVPVPGFLGHAAAAIAHQPTGLIGFYVGQTRPRKTQVARAVQDAEHLDASWLEADTLLWGVAAAIPTRDLPELLGWARTSKLPYDARIGRWYRNRKIPVRYTWPSLVDHADGPSVIPNRPRPLPRTAWRAGQPASWDGPVVQIGR